MAKDDAIKIHLKNGFSNRKGIIKVSEIVQIDFLIERTRATLYNFILEVISELTMHGTSVQYHGYNAKYYTTVVKYIYTDLLSKNIDDIPIRKLNGVYHLNRDEFFNLIKSIFYDCDYNEVLDFLEGLSQHIINNYSPVAEDYIEQLNIILSEENVGYRVIEGIITDIVTEEEIESIEESIESGFTSVSIHFQKALALLSDREQPDYENSIKESISSVEAMCRIILKEDKLVLSVALNKLEKNGVVIHPVLKEAFQKLYAYAGDEKGVRHAGGIGNAKSTFSEAKFMLVSCSAFVNYLKENA